MAREFLRITPEAVWGTFDATADPVIIDLDQNNAYDARPAPVRQAIRTAGGYNRRWATVSGKTELKGNLNMLVHGSQGPALAAWIDNGGAAAPASYTIDHVIVMEDTGATKVYARDLGMMVAQAQLTASEQDVLLRAKLQLIGKRRSASAITVTDFAEPALADYASDPFYTFEMAGSSLTLGSTRTEFASFDLTVKNMFDARFFNSQYLTRLKYCGRDVDWTTSLPYGVTTDRSNYESITAVSGAITFTSGANSLAFAMHSKNFYAGVKDDLSLDKLFLQEVSMEAYVDRTAGTDFTITAA